MKKILAMILALVLAAGLCVSAGAEDADYKTLSVTSPGGAPALALASFVAAEEIPHEYILANEIAAAFSDNKADFVIAPVNAGAIQFKKLKGSYQLAAVVSWGNLFIASQKEGLTAEDLNGAEIILFGEHTINASVVLYALEQNGIVPAKVDYLGSAELTKDALLGDPEAIVVTAEPALTAARFAARKEEKTISAIAVNDLLKQAGMDGYAQAALFVRKETAQEQPEAVAAWLKKAEEACALCEADVPAVAEAAVALGILGNAKVAEAGIPGCAIRYVGAAEAKALIEATAAIDLSQFGGEVPADEFYYDGAQ